MKKGMKYEGIFLGKRLFKKDQMRDFCRNKKISRILSESSILGRSQRVSFDQWHGKRNDSAELWFDLEAPRIQKEFQETFLKNSKSNN